MLFGISIILTQQNDGHSFAVTVLVLNMM